MRKEAGERANLTQIRPAEFNVIFRISSDG